MLPSCNVLLSCDGITSGMKWLLSSGMQGFAYRPARDMHMGSQPDPKMAHLRKAFGMPEVGGMPHVALLVTSAAYLCT